VSGVRGARNGAFNAYSLKEDRRTQLEEEKPETAQVTPETVQDVTVTEEKTAGINS
jgi:hypothetical protein